MPLQFFVAMHHVPHQLPVRELKTDCIGRLVAVSGTVTRSSEVRPELLVACFRCTKCGLVAPPIEQQYHYTRPTLCRNPRCQNRTEFVLERRESQFCDWQKLRVQENSHEIPPGSMPRSINVIMRNEMVERAKAGDKCVFTGSLVVIPDGSALARAGEAVQATSGRVRPQDNAAATGGGGGVKGLKALGVKELTYRTCFVASSVVQMETALRTKQTGNTTASMVASFLFGTANPEQQDPTMRQVAMEFTEEERDDIRNMKSSPHLYERVSWCLCMLVYGVVLLSCLAVPSSLLI